MEGFDIEYWLSEAELSKIKYSEYWNNEEKEKSKEWYILDGNFSKMEDYLKKTELPDDLIKCVNTLKVSWKRELCGRGIDLAAGNLWATRYLFELGRIDKLYCLEYSKHRLLKIGIKVLEHYQVPKEKVTLVLGSFYDLHLNDNFLDFVFLSQAFHHADKPDKLLSEIQRVLKPGGIIIIIGEHLIRYSYFRHAVKFVVSKVVPKRIQQVLFGKTFQIKSLIPKSIPAVSPDPITGDHYYTSRNYKSFFLKHGFKMKHLKNHKSQLQSFVLLSKSAEVSRL